MQHKAFRQLQDLLSGFDTYIEAYASYLHSGSIPPCLEDDIHRLEQQQLQQHDDGENQDETDDDLSSTRDQPEEWMLICNTYLQQSTDTVSASSQIDWTEAARRYSNLEEAPSFVSRNREATHLGQLSTIADPHLLAGKQRIVYDAVCNHFHSATDEPLRLIVSGTAGTGKSYLIHALRDFCRLMYVSLHPLEWQPSM